MKPKLLVVGSGPRGELVGDPFKKHFDLHTMDIDQKVKPHTVGDMRRMPFENESFEAVMAQHVLEHVSSTDVGRAIKEMYRVLKPGGEIFIGVPNLAFACERILEGKIFEAAYCIRPDGTSRGYPITPLDMVYGWHVMVRFNKGWTHRYGFTRESLFKWMHFNPELRWSFCVSHEVRMLGDLDRTEVRFYGIKEGKPTYEHFSEWANNHDLDVGDPYAVKEEIENG